MNHTTLNKLIRSRFARKSVAGLLVSSLLLAAPVYALVEGSTPIIGEVTFVLGKPIVEKADGSRERITRGTSINVSDRIETGSNGHVHIRFVDNELVSVRPSSLLEIVRYDYDPAAPENSNINLNFVEGVTRAISGKAAKAAPENFRMDTPIAAIGVRGTDFVVSSNQDGIRAKVNEGAIIIAPYSSECLVAAFGPCSLNALELAGGTNQIVEISANTNEALLLSLSPLPIPDVSLEPVTAGVAVTSAETKSKEEGLYTDSVTSKVVTLAFATAKNLTSITPIPPVIVATPEFTPEASLSAASLTSNQLVWGRWSETTDFGFERITTLYDTAIADGRRVTVANNVYGLYRTEFSTDEVHKDLGSLAFNLNEAQAVLTSNGQSDLMNVTGGVLNIDFNQNLFSTNLQMNHALTGNVEFSESGRVFGNGIFHSSNANGTPVMAGAVSIDGTEAGYFFSKILDSGIIEGLTLWGVKP
ncbi:MAG: FecR family protein [Pseudomonadota bacterium]